MPRARLLDFRISSGPTDIGLCQSDVAGCAQAVNAAQQELILAPEAKDWGWWGSWAFMAFNVDQVNPYITTPRDVARLERMTVCNRPVRIQNQFYEYLDFGIGLQPSNNCRFPQACQELQAYERGTVPTFSDLRAGTTLRIYVTNAGDVGKRVLVQGTDQNDEVLYSMDGLVQVTGDYLSLDAPFVESDVLNSVTGLQKDQTLGPVKFFEVDSSGNQRLLLTMEPSETTANYRRYFINGLPKSCCNPIVSTTTVQVTAMAKLEFIPCQVDSDWLLIQNIPALIKQCQSIRLGNMDEFNAKQQAAERHVQAIRMLQGEINHYQGTHRPAIIVAPFGSARLRRQGIGQLI